MRHRVLLVEDDSLFVELVQQALARSEFDLQTCPLAEKGLKLAQADPPDLILLDWGLPDFSGISFLKAMRSHPQLKSLPVLMVTAREGVPDRVTGLECGADDYLFKPIHPRELLARMRSLLRRKEAAVSGASSLRAEDLFFDPEKHVICLGKKNLDLFPKEYEILQYLLKRRGYLVSREDLVSRVWGFQKDPRSTTVDFYIASLRKKLGPRWARRLETFRSLGYKLS